jgi:hypothetical protein
VGHSIVVVVVLEDRPLTARVTNALESAGAFVVRARGVAQRDALLRAIAVDGVVQDVDDAPHANTFVARMDDPSAFEAWLRSTLDRASVSGP